MNGTSRRRIRRCLRLARHTAFVVSTVGIALAPPLLASTVPPGFTESQVATGLTDTIAMAFAPDGRLFVCEKAGRVRTVENGVLQTTPFLTLKNVETVGSNGSNGLLGIAFDPQFLANGYFYVHYTVRKTRGIPAHNRISRFTSSGSTADPQSEQVLLELHDISSTGHYGGDLRFGPDGKLYIAVGMYDSPGSAQLLTDLKGKILRIDADASGLIPSDNPFLGQTTGSNAAIWALGLRNPFTFAFDPATGRMFINDVGEAAFEEINEAAAGANYGWPDSEGPTSNPAHSNPVHWYGRDQGCALTAGTFYSPATPTFPTELVGKYFFADWCSGWIRTIDPAAPSTATPFATGTAFVMDLEVGPDGSLYYIQWQDTAVYRIAYGAGPAPKSTTVTTLTSSTAVAAAGTPVTFTAIVTRAGSDGGVVTGAVDFYDGAVRMNAVPVELVNGLAAFTTSSLAKGSHRISAVYSGSDEYLPSTSPVLSQRIKP